MMRIGQGFDVHAFAPIGSATQFALGGISIPDDRGVIAHSDGDVLLHALMDAILGALGLEDIGHQFPDTDPAYQNADSRDLLKAVVQLMRDARFSVINVDATVLLEAPKVKPYRPLMIAAIAEGLGCDVSCVSVKATTTEKLGFVGRGEGLAAQVVVLLSANRA
ncbi:2-C-methyl-D-erythritol 2,4-cyclodiphosphate synthase [Pseudomonadales bacterium]|nr:2-C-methyl-D-erythritol 2,4-cyclodiphosphate synthase [Pseudomonadales bacterium]